MCVCVCVSVCVLPIQVDARGLPVRRASCPELSETVGIPPTYYIVFTLDGKPEVLAALINEGVVIPEDMRGQTRKILQWAKANGQLNECKCVCLGVRVPRCACAYDICDVNVAA